MQSSRLGAVALVAAVALWAQLALIPFVGAGSHSGLFAAVAVIGAALALAIPVVGIFSARTRPRFAVAAVLAMFPCALGIVGVITGQQSVARFDALARVIAAATGVGFLAVSVLWAQSLSVAVPTTIAVIDHLPIRPPAPPLRDAAFLLLCAVATSIAIVAPVLVSAHPPASRSEILGGENLVTARETLTAAGGLAIAILLILAAGSALLRGRAARKRRATRGLAFLVWAVAIVGLKLLIDRLH